MRYAFSVSRLTSANRMVYCGMKLSKEDMEFAHDTIHGAREYAESENFPEDTAWDEAECTLQAAGFSKEEISEAFEQFNLLF